MRGFQCHYYHMKADGKLVKNINTACWAGIHRCPPLKDDSMYINEKLAEETKDCLFVENFEQPETKEFIPLLVRIMNKITLCELVTIETKEYLKIKLPYNKYDNNLILLNFIRNLWSCPSIFNGKSPDKAVYTKTFFETLRDARRYKDPLKRLLWANKVACEKIAGCGSMGHSNIHNAEKLTIRSAEELKAYNGYSTEAFLTGVPKDNKA